MAAPGGESTGDPVAVVRLGARLDPLMGLSDRGDLGPVRKAVREGLDARLAQALELRPALAEQVGSAAFRLLVHDGEPIARLRALDLGDLELLLRAARR